MPAACCATPMSTLRPDLRRPGERGQLRLMCAWPGRARQASLPPVLPRRAPPQTHGPARAAPVRKFLPLRATNCAVSLMTSTSSRVRPSGTCTCSTTRQARCAWPNRVLAPAGARARSLLLPAAPTTPTTNQARPPPAAAAGRASAAGSQPTVYFSSTGFSRGRVVAGAAPGASCGTVPCATAVAAASAACFLASKLSAGAFCCPSPVISSVKCVTCESWRGMGRAAVAPKRPRDSRLRLALGGCWTVQRCCRCHAVSTGMRSLSTRAAQQVAGRLSCAASQPALLTPGA